MTTVNYTAVRRAQRKVGDQLEAERLERIRVRDAAECDDGDDCGCAVLHPRWCAWNGPCCDSCTHDGADHAECCAPAERRYGPHTDDTAPRTVTVYGAGRYPTEEERPIPTALLEQRQRINNIAWETA